MVNSVNFPLSKLLRVRQIQEQQREHLLAETMRSRNGCELDVKQAEHMQTGVGQALCGHLEGAVNLSAAKELREQYVYRGLVLEQRRLLLSNAEEEVFNERQHMVDARRRRRVVDKIQERCQAQFAWELQQQEQYRLDELGVQIYRRERR